MANNLEPICPQCGEKIHPTSAFLAPDLLEEVEWICKKCGYKKRKVGPKEDIRLGESVKTNKNPT